MPKMVVQRQDGTVITVEGTEAEIKRIIALLDGQSPQNSRSAERPSTDKVTIASMLQELSDEGYFDNPRSLSDIRDALGAHGSIYATTTLSAQVLRQVRKRKLGRIKDQNQWKYVKR